MKLYKEEDKEIIFQTQNRDPFFNYLTEKIMEEMEYRKGGRVLDIGCGAGRNVVAAAKLGFEVVGVDIDKKSLEVAKDYIKSEKLDGKVNLIHADIMKQTPKRFGLFDYIILQEVIEHVSDYQKLIDFSYNYLKKGGKILITTPNDPKQWNVLDDYAEHVRRFKLSEVKEALKKFKKIKIYTTGFPFHRLIIFLYNVILKINGQDHQARTFRHNKIYHFFYYWIGTFLLRIDDFFRFTHWGDAMVAVGEK